MTEAALVTLRGHGVVLAPLEQAHAQGLADASADGEIWQLHYTTAPEPSLDAASAYIQAARDGHAAGTSLPFAVLGDAGKVLGSTRYYDIDATVPTCAIGYTWYAASVQRSHVNSTCKLLLLRHAFETLGMRTVYFHTNHQNLRSQAAIERLGAKRDGILRQHKRQKDGSLRDTVCYSILDSEWPAVQQRLEGWFLSRASRAQAP